MLPYELSNRMHHVRELSKWERQHASGARERTALVVTVRVHKKHKQRECLARSLSEERVRIQLDSVVRCCCIGGPYRSGRRCVLDTRCGCGFAICTYASIICVSFHFHFHSFYYLYRCSSNSTFPIHACLWIRMIERRNKRHEYNIILYIYTERHLLIYIYIKFMCKKSLTKLVNLEIFDNLVHLICYISLVLHSLLQNLNLIV